MIDLLLLVAPLSMAPPTLGGPPVLVEPGRAWTYEATIAVGGPPVLVEPGRAWTYEATVAVGGPPVLVEPGRAWTYEATVAVGGPPVLVEPGRAWTYEATVALGGPPVLVEPGRAWNYEATVAAGGPPVLVEPGRAWAYEANVKAGGPPVLVEPGRAWNYEASVAVGGPPVLVEPGRAWTYEGDVAAGGPPVLVEPGRAWTYEAIVSLGGPPVLVEPGRSWNYEANVKAGGPPVLVEPGRAWAYEGKAGACPSAKPVRVSYVVLPASEEGSDVSVLRKIEAPKSGKACESEKSSCHGDVALLHLRSDYIQKGVEPMAKAKAPNAEYFDFAPIPPAYAKVLVGSKREDTVKISVPSFTFAPGRVWTATTSEDGGTLEVVCAAKSLPATAENCAETKLEGYREVYRINALTGVTETFERTWRVREGAKEPRDVTVSLKLVDFKDLTDEEVREASAAIRPN
ncbi:MAG: hypothetical protein L0323_05510 [Planctomycetes bacterium]|nr:hypothetical protein [Planctomycetota bacterium]